MILNQALKLQFLIIIPKKITYLQNSLQESYFLKL